MFNAGDLVRLTYCEPGSSGYQMGLRVGHIGTVRRSIGCWQFDCTNCAGESSLVDFPSTQGAIGCISNASLRKIGGDGRQVVDFDWRTLVTNHPEVA